MSRKGQKLDFGVIDRGYSEADSAFFRCITLRKVRLSGWFIGLVQGFLRQPPLYRTILRFVYSFKFDYLEVFAKECG